MAAGRDLQALLFSRPVYRRRNDLAVPVNQLRGIRLVEQIYRHRDALSQPNQRTGYGPVVSQSADRVFFCDVCQYSTDVQRHVGRARGSGIPGRIRLRRRRAVAPGQENA